MIQNEYILMLDMEGVIFATSIGTNQLMLKDSTIYGIRPYAKEFLQEVKPLFLEHYLNTCVPEERAQRIMKENLGADFFQYHNWERGPEDKSFGYENFTNKTIIHIEDSAINPYTLSCWQQRILDLGHQIIPVFGQWYPGSTMETRSDDKELLKVLREIQNIIGIIGP